MGRSQKRHTACGGGVRLRDGRCCGQKQANPNKEQSTNCIHSVAPRGLIPRQTTAKAGNSTNAGLGSPDRWGTSVNLQILHTLPDKSRVKLQEAAPGISRRRAGV